MNGICDLVRRVALRAVDSTEVLWRRSNPLLPPAHLRRSYYRSPDPEVFGRACQVAAAELLTRGLEPRHHVLEVGCGLGNLALGLSHFLTDGRYEGFDIHGPAVRWCQRAITPRFPNFRFHHADI